MMRERPKLGDPPCATLPMQSRADFNNDAEALRAKVAFLKQPASYPKRPPRVRAIETHMSWVFLTDAHAYKLEKPVRYEFVDFSTLEARQHGCEEEIRLNRRLAPDVYLAIVPLILTTSGQLQLGQPGAIANWLVQMRRLPEQRMLDALIKKQAVTKREIDQLVQILVRCYLHK